MHYTPKNEEVKKLCEKAYWIANQEKGLLRALAEQVLHYAKLFDEDTGTIIEGCDKQHDLGVELTHSEALRLDAERSLGAWQEACAKKDEALVFKCGASRCVDFTSGGCPTCPVHIARSLQPSPNRFSNLEAENGRLVEALRKINTGRHTMGAAEMAVIAWAALSEYEKGGAGKKEG